LSKGGKKKRDVKKTLDGFLNAKAKKEAISRGHVTIKRGEGDSKKKRTGKRETRGIRAS